MFSKTEGDRVKGMEKFSKLIKSPQIPLSFCV